MTENKDTVSLPITDVEKRAQEIYTALRSYTKAHQGFTTLDSLRRATTFFPEDRLIYEITITYPRRPEEVLSFVNRGLAEADVKQGVTAIRGFEMIISDPSHPIRNYQKGQEVSHVFIADSEGRGYVVVGDADNKGELNMKETIALGSRDALSKVVEEIVDTYGNFDKFDAALRTSIPRPDFVGINYVDAERGTILYNGGLKEFVQAQENAKALVDPQDSTERIIRS